MSKYGITDEEYLEIFGKHAKKIIAALQKLEEVCYDSGFELRSFTDRFIWNLFQDITYDSDDEARLIQKKTDPDGYKENWALESILSPSKEEIMDEIKAIRALLESRE